MIQAAVDGVVAAIRAEYGEAYEIYTESLEQGLREPCFSVLCLTSGSNAKMGCRYDQSYLLTVRYFPASETEPVAECQRVCAVLLGLLDTIRIDGALAHASDISGVITDGVLSMTVSYRMLTLLQRPSDPEMEEIEARTAANYD